MLRHVVLGLVVATLASRLRRGVVVDEGASADDRALEQDEQVGVDPEDQFIRVIAREPRPGMTPTQVVQGFLDASASFDGDHAVARQYLTPAASTEWNTGAGVSVYDGAAALTELGTTVVVSADEAGEIASNGRFEVAGPSAEAADVVPAHQGRRGVAHLELPPGLLLSQSDVDRAFRSFAVYFFNPSFSTLVPDARMVPVIGPGLATTLVAGSSPDRATGWSPPCAPASRPGCD